MLPDQQLLRIPGPTPIPASVQRAMAQPMIGHRSLDFKQLFERIIPRLKPVFGTKQDVVILASSGTGGLEAAVVSTVQTNEAVLVLVTGAFGDRFAKICEAYQLNVHRIDVTWGKAVDPKKVQTYLETHPEIKAVFATYCETSTGVKNPIKEIAEVVNQYSDALMIVDGVSSIGGIEVKMDEWGIDVLTSSSQKAFMLPAGLAFIAVSERALKKMESNKQPCFYFNLLKYKKNMADFSTPFTPAVSLIFGLDQVLTLFEEEGLENVYKRHLTMQKMVRASIKALNLPLLASDKDSSPTVTAIRPTNFKADELRNLVKKEFGLTLAGGQQHLKGEIFRIGHMGHCSPADILQTISLIELGLHKLGVGKQFGVGTAAAQEVYLKEEV